MIARRSRRRGRHRAARTARFTPSAGVNDGGVFVLEVAARPIGGLCAARAAVCRSRRRRLRCPRYFTPRSCCCGTRSANHRDDWRRETSASGVMMIPIPRRGVLPRRGRASTRAGRVPCIDDVRITAKARSAAGAAAGGRQLPRVHLRARRHARRRPSSRPAGGARASASSPSIPKSRCVQSAAWLIAVRPRQPPAPPSNSSGRKVLCAKFQKELPALDAPPWPGELGQRIYENISAGCLEALGRADEDDPQRVPPDAVAEGGAGSGCQTHGGVLLRRRSGASPGMCPNRRVPISEARPLTSALDAVVDRGNAKADTVWQLRATELTTAALNPFEHSPYAALEHPTKACGAATTPFTTTNKPLSEAKHCKALVRRMVHRAKWLPYLRRLSLRAFELVHG